MCARHPGIAMPHSASSTTPNAALVTPDAAPYDPASKPNASPGPCRCGAPHFMPHPSQPSSYAESTPRDLPIPGQIGLASVLNERLGDARTQVVLRAHDTIVREAVGAHGGTVVKS